MRAAAVADSSSPPDSIEFVSPLIQLGTFRCPPSHPLFHARVPTRGHCFVFPRHAVWIAHDGQDRFVADANVVPLYNPTRPYRRWAIGGQADHSDWFAVAPDLLRELVTTLDPGVRDADGLLFTRPCAPATASIYLEQREVFTRVQRGEADPLYVEERGVALLARVLELAYGRTFDAPGQTPRHRRLAEDTRALVAQSVDRPLSLGALARAMSVSPFHLCRVFRARTGGTIQRYRSQLRLRRSLSLLAEDGRDVLDVAVALGYSSHSHFTRAFHAAFGVTPSAWRAGARRQGGPANTRSR